MTNFLSFPRLFSILLWLVGGLVILFLIAPIVAIVPLSFNAEPFFTYPMPGLSLRWYREFFDSNVWQLALKNSIIVAVFATLLSTFLGTLAAIGLSRPSCPARATLTAILISPMIVPVIVSASASIMPSPPSVAQQPDRVGAGAYGDRRTLRGDHRDRDAGKLRSQSDAGGIQPRRRPG